ncbi:MAG: hypothetical protein A3C30_02165 [Candidatus Levybacteria bacterium RIFCSPHIGHO2_02_FULL_40_18]|nr:MAG: hypothetical protein A2869_04545 [Candidatus Levybacteria bacterium RIFCSPHIGHO2_01_FULL_40_58]OGH26794.1 MAG: hypothetical protein A3C30_02165 [Candidatus Levybacteria bacterium RIFCSPHIGHO2_02_FULL_40_18]OGH31729.1 MAG: hypothetical protein A3E43_01885 [Candidatus Levybacteria bacterium RIFCSPHIGHO2_12_FULL_40_31]OGH40629.1 MAG: hypothetical protein A2894_00435 [Candidatus Levybacteria bacterium RIFCSPLOWO2_01_FULL_40_64]OGH48801.1 MAG: hypothetical protein A3I54_04060 [Candidatus Lev
MKKESRKGFTQHHFRNLIEYCKNGAGFTLVELLVVIVIISVLAGLLVSNFIGVRLRGRDAQRKSDLAQIQSALELYRADNGYYPATLYSTACPTSGSFSYNSIVYMRKIPCDPLQKTNYTYTAAPAGCSTDCTTYRIYACLENTNDSNKDANDGQAGDLCTSAGVVSYTVINP